jgi:hypothetical protein
MELFGYQRSRAEPGVSLLGGEGRAACLRLVGLVLARAAAVQLLELVVAGAELPHLQPKAATAMDQLFGS